MTTITSSTQALENYFNQLQGQKVGVVKFQELKNLVLKDQKVDQDEARFLMDKLSSQAYELSTIPMVLNLIQTSAQEKTPLPAAYVGRNHLTNVKEVAEEFKDLKKATPLTDKNGIDEVYFTDSDGKLYVAYGGADTKGAMDLEGLKVGYVGRLGDKKIQVVHLNNENNTAWEGAKSPWISTWDTLSTAGQSSIVSGIGTAATTLTSLFIGKAVLENSVKTAGEQLANQAGQKTAEAVSGKAISGVVGQAKVQAQAIGSSIKSTIGNSLRSVVVGAAVVGAVVGTVAAAGSVIGVVHSQQRMRDFATLDMVTGNY